MIDTWPLAPRLRTFESVAAMARVTSTNAVARRIVAECAANDLSLPQAIIIAGEQTAGRGRNDRTWSSPAGKGIYATFMLTRSTSELPLMPLAMAVAVARFVIDVFAVDVKVKWPNDVLASGRKLAGILTEARVQEDRAFLIVGVGINVDPVSSADRPNAVALAELTSRPFGGVDGATVAFIEHVDRRLSQPLRRDEVIAAWRRLAAHRPGDAITCATPDRTIAGQWRGIDDEGRALIATRSGVVPVSTGEIVG